MMRLVYCRFIVILYIPVLCLWRAGRKVLVTPKQQNDELICASNLELCLSPPSSDTEDDRNENDSGSKRKWSKRNSDRKTTPRIRRTFAKVLPAAYGGRVCWRAATQVSLL